MRWWHELRYLLRHLARNRSDDDLNEEIRTHLELEAARNVEAGMTDEEARYAALRAFGNVARAKEQSRAVWRLGGIEAWWRDLRYGARLLRRSPGFTAAAVLTLALGVGVNAAVFSVVNGVLLQPLPHVDVDAWAYLSETSPPPDGTSNLSASGPNFRDWREQSRSFEAMVAFMLWNYNLTAVDEPERLRAAIVTPELFDALGLAPSAGRTLVPEDAEDSERPVMISHGLWQRRFGGDPAVVGAKVMLNAVPHTVVGVAPRGFSFPPEAPTDVWTPMPEALYGGEDRSMRGLQVAAKLKPGVSMDAARAEMAAIARNLSEAYPENAGYGVAISPMRDAIAEELRPMLLALWGATVFVLLLACVNVANLQLARLEARGHEVAIRSALGAGRAAVLRQLLAESLVLTLVAGGLGLLAAPWGVGLLLALVPPDVGPPGPVSLDTNVVAASAALLLVVVAISGLLPALKASRPDPLRTLRGATAAGKGVPSLGARQAFIVVQLALSFVPLVGAGLLIQSFVRLQRVDPGIEPENRVVMSLSAPTARYREPSDVSALAERLREEVAAVPGVLDAGLASDVPFTPAVVWLQAASRADPSGVADLAALPLVRYAVAGPGYFETLGIAVQSGRAIAASDDQRALPVIVVNEALARNLFPGEDPVGKLLWAGHAELLPGSPPRQVVGVVRDVKMTGLAEEPRPAAYVPIAQQEVGLMVWRNLHLVVHTSGDPGGFVAALKERIKGTAPDLAPANVSTLGERVRDSAWRPRFAANVIGALGVAALALAVVGVYGVTSFVVLRRTREIAIRMALGAGRRDILLLICGRNVALVAAGLALGAAGAAALTRWLTSLLYGVEPFDALTFACLAALLGAVAMAASYVPARRATAVDPGTALRFE
jgi:predicted permease